MSVARRRADYNEGLRPCRSSDLPLSEPVTFTDPDYFDCEPSLNGDEAAHFKRKGFIVKQGLIDDTEIFKKVVDFIWTKVPRGLLRGRIQCLDQSCQRRLDEADSLKVGMLARDNWKIPPKPIWHWHRGVIDRRDRDHPNVRQVVTALIRAPVRRSSRPGCILHFLRHRHRKSLQRAR